MVITLSDKPRPKKPDVKAAVVNATFGNGLLFSFAYESGVEYQAVLQPDEVREEGVTVLFGPITDGHFNVVAKCWLVGDTFDNANALWKSLGRSHETTMQSHGKGHIVKWVVS